MSAEAYISWITRSRAIRQCRWSFDDCFHQIEISGTCGHEFMVYVLIFRSLRAESKTEPEILTEAIIIVEIARYLVFMSTLDRNCIAANKITIGVCRCCDHHRTVSGIYLITPLLIYNLDGSESVSLGPPCRVSSFEAFIGELAQHIAIQFVVGLGYRCR